MDKQVTLKMGPYKGNWYALGKGNMNPDSFNKLVASLSKAFKQAYGNNYKEYMDIIENGAALFLLAIEKKVPNVAKVIIEHPRLPGIQIEIKGYAPDGTPKAEILKSPFDQNKCKSVIPYYNGVLLNNNDKSDNQRATPTENINRR